MTGNLTRALAIIELLAKHGGRMQLAAIADTLDIPRSGTHRLLSMLIGEGYVRQDEEHGEYRLALKLVSLALIHLSTGGILDVSQPVLDRLAAASGELARLGVVEGDHLTFVAKAQGARSGLRYDPDMGSQPPLYCTANGQAWLASLSDEEALVRAGGLGKAGQGGPNAPRSIAQLLQDLQTTRLRGYSIAIETHEAGMTAMAASIRHAVTRDVVGVVSIAGPTSRLPERRLEALAPALLEAASDMSAATLNSPFLKRSPGARAPAVI